MKNGNEQTEWNKELARRIFPEDLPTPEELEKKYPPRNLPEDAMVTRVGPSPTGFMHLGGVYASLISERLAHQTDGVFFLRIEDTDQARSKPETTELIVNSLDMFGIPTDEGRTVSGSEKGSYGPYTQSERGEIYRACVKDLLLKGKAYPCFCTQDELQDIDKKQDAEIEEWNKKEKERRDKSVETGTQEKEDEPVCPIQKGYYGKWAKWRDAAPEDIRKELEKGTPYVIRLRSEGDFGEKHPFDDLLKGKVMLPENQQDRVLLKSSTNLPTYHLAHAVDDHFMRTTHVLRGDEWLSSVPLHLELFRSLGFDVPKYGHLAPLNKMEGNSKRKISKRKDPEANALLYEEEGYPPEAVVEYLLNLANSTFEDWRKENPDKDNKEFELTLERLSRSNGPLFDFVKLNDISKNIIARFSPEEVYERSLSWAKKFSPELAAEMEADPEYAKRAENVDKDNPSRARKDLVKWSDIPTEAGYFFDKEFSKTSSERRELLSDTPEEAVGAAVEAFLKTYDENDAPDAWFDKVKSIARDLGYADNMKEYKKDPSKFKGNVADIAKIFRVLLTGKTATPDLFSIMKVMGKERVKTRLTSR